VALVETPTALLRAWGQRQAPRGSPVHGSFAEIQRTTNKWTIGATFKGALTYV